jgi:hypothetical protein
VAVPLLSTPVGQAVAEELRPEHGKINTGDATPVAAGVVEIEVGYAPSWTVRRGWGSFDDSATAYDHAFGLQVTWGPIDALDFSLATGYAFVYDAGNDDARPGPTKGHGHLDDSITGRYRFLSTGPLDLAITTGVTLPTGAESSPRLLGTCQGYVSWDSALVTSADAGRATGNLELGVSLPLGPGREEVRAVALANLAGGYHVLAWLQPELELNYERDVSVGSDPEILAVTAGAVAPWGKGNRVSAGVQQAIWGRHTSAFTSASIAYKAAF